MTSVDKASYGSTPFNGAIQWNWRKVSADIMKPCPQRLWVSFARDGCSAKEFCCNFRQFRFGFPGSACFSKLPPPQKFAKVSKVSKTSSFLKKNSRCGIHHSGGLTLLYTWPQEAVCCSVLQRVAVCCSVLQCVTVCWSVLECVAVCCSALQQVAACCSMLQCVSVRCSELQLQCVAVCCSVLQHVAACCSVLQRVAVRCSALQCVAVRCSALQHVAAHYSTLQCSAFTQN